jgi:DNA-binding NarL/FixJ family response regulator
VRDQVLLAGALVTALEQALRDAHRLLGALNRVAGCQRGRAAHPPHAGPRPALIGPRATPSGPMWAGADRAASAPHDAPAAPTAPGGLSRREAQVLRLLAAGGSNRDIAQALCLSPRTVQRHVANLYRKIGAHSRAEATAYAIDHDLR